jgi:hypothetical protein
MILAFLIACLLSLKIVTPFALKLLNSETFRLVIVKIFGLQNDVDINPSAIAFPKLPPPNIVIVLIKLNF